MLITAFPVSYFQIIIPRRKEVHPCFANYRLPGQPPQNRILFSNSQSKKDSSANYYSTHTPKLGSHSQMITPRRDTSPSSIVIISQLPPFLKNPVVLFSNSQSKKKLSSANSLPQKIGVPFSNNPSKRSFPPSLIILYSALSSMGFLFSNDLQEEVPLLFC